MSYYTPPNVPYALEMMEESLRLQERRHFSFGYGDEDDNDMFGAGGSLSISTDHHYNNFEVNDDFLISPQQDSFLWNSKTIDDPPEISILSVPRTFPVTNRESTPVVQELFAHSLIDPTNPLIPRHQPWKSRVLEQEGPRPATPVVRELFGQALRTAVVPAHAARPQQPKECHIMKLPVEIMEMIFFEHAFPHFSPDCIMNPTWSADRWNESKSSLAVCRQWRRIILPRLLRAITISQCTFLSLNRVCTMCGRGALKLCIPWLEHTRIGEDWETGDSLMNCVWAVRLSSDHCEHRSSRHFDENLEGRFIASLPNLKQLTVNMDVLDSYAFRLKGFYDMKTKPDIILENARPAPRLFNRRMPFPESLRYPPRAYPFPDTSWINFGEAKKVTFGGCHVSNDLLSTFKNKLHGVEVIEISSQTDINTFLTPSGMDTFFTSAARSFSNLTTVIMRCTPTLRPSGLRDFRSPSFSPDVCHVIARIPTLKMVDILSCCQNFFHKAKEWKTGRSLELLRFETTCPDLQNFKRSAKHKYSVNGSSLRAVIEAAQELEKELEEDIDRLDRKSIRIEVSVAKERELGRADISPSLSPVYTFYPIHGVVNISEYTCKAPNKYRVYVSSLSVPASTASLINPSPSVRRMRYSHRSISPSNPHIEMEDCTRLQPRKSKLWRWNYSVDQRLFFSRNEFLMNSRAKDKILNGMERALKGLQEPKGHRRRRKPVNYQALDELFSRPSEVSDIHMEDDGPEEN